jgi:methionine sulfoxide reductase heme-binding subunit
VGGSLTWVTTRAAGYTSFALLTASVALGLLLSSRWRSPRWPRFATTELHRFVTLLTLVFIGIHMLMALLDRFIRFSLIEVLVPFVSHYRPQWTGLGIIAAYLGAALWLSTWLQRQIGYRWWRRLHFATFAVYAAACAHGIGSGSDTGSAWSWSIYVASFLLVGGLLVLRISVLDRRARAEPVTVAARPAAAAWPTQPAAPGFEAHLEGTMHQGPDGPDGIVMQLEGTLWGGFDGSLELLVQGWVPPEGGRVNVTDNWLYLRSRSGPTYEGHISAFDGMRLRGQVSRHHNGGPRFAVLIDLLALKAGAVSGLVQAAPIEEGQPSGLGTAR